MGQPQRPIGADRSAENGRSVETGSEGVRPASIEDPGAHQTTVAVVEAIEIAGELMSVAKEAAAIPVV